MKKTIVSAAICMFLFTVLGACNKGREAIPAATNIPGNVKVLIYVTDTGDITILDSAGNELEACVLPTPDADKTTDKEPAQKATHQKETAEKETAADECKVCQGMDKGSAVTNIQMLTIMKTNSGHCITIGINSDGTPRQLCW